MGWGTGSGGAATTEAQELAPRFGLGASEHSTPGLLKSSWAPRHL